MGCQIEFWTEYKIAVPGICQYGLWAYGFELMAHGSAHIVWQVFDTSFQDQSDSDYPPCHLTKPLDVIIPPS